MVADTPEHRRIHVENEEKWKKKDTCLEMCLQRVSSSCSIFPVLRALLLLRSLSFDIEMALAVLSLVIAPAQRMSFVVIINST